LNAAAITDVDACERDRALAWQVNVGLVETLAGVCRMLGAHLVQLSSDYVFEGKQGPYAEQARPNPLNYYGKTKLAAENVCQTAAPSVTIVRTTHIYGTPAPWSSDILRWALSQVRQGMVVPAAVDLYTNPIFVDDLARALLTAIRRRDEGIVHVAGREWLSRYEFLRTAFRVLELPQELLVPMAAAELYRGRAPRPLRAGLLCERAEALWHFHPRSLEEALWVVRYRLQSRESEAGDTSE
jgi:dTDP-4-dehydrorhamnose reductase